MSDEVERILGRMEAKIDIVLTRIDRHEEKFSNYDAIKNKIIGWIVGVGLTAGAAGASVSKALASLFHGGQP